MQKVTQISIKSLVLSVICMALLTSCNNKRPASQETFKLSIPDTSKSKRANIILNGLSFLREHLELTSLKRGVDSFELRVWVTGFVEPCQLITIKYVDSTWLATRTDYWFEGQRFDSLITIRLMLKNKQKIVDSIRQFDLFNIPTQDEIGGFSDSVADGFYFTIELAGKNYYKLLQYHCPDQFPNEQFNKRVVSFLLFIQRNLTNFTMCNT